jgi:phospholipid/cholesterol/gamma-HCH transport system substrate-binding protein
MSAVERREYLVGICAAIVLVAVLLLTAISNRRAQDADADPRFLLTADFARADGIYTGSPVRLAGMKIGEVTKSVLANGRAVLTMRFTTPVALPEDTAAVIETDGLFGTKYIEMRPGGEEKNFASGARMTYSQDSVILEDLIALIVARTKTKPAADESVPQ